MKDNLEKIKEIYINDDLGMFELLGAIKCSDIDKDMTIEDAFELYVEAKKWADGDIFTVDKMGEVEVL
jgi:hypothetical protein